jgi:hypothetical protein
MAGLLTSKLAMLALAGAAIVTAQPRLHIAMENLDDPNPRRFALTGELMGKVLGVVISWSADSVRLPIRQS